YDPILYTVYIEYRDDEGNWLTKSVPLYTDDSEVDEETDTTLFVQNPIFKLLDKANDQDIQRYSICVPFFGYLKPGERLVLEVLTDVNELQAIDRNSTTTIYYALNGTAFESTVYGGSAILKTESDY